MFCTMTVLLQRSLRPITSLAGLCCLLPFSVFYSISSFLSRFIEKRRRMISLRREKGVRWSDEDGEWEELEYEYDNE